MVGVQPGVEGASCPAAPSGSSGGAARQQDGRMSVLGGGAPKATDWASFLFYLKTMGSTKSHLCGK